MKVIKLKSIETNLKNANWINQKQIIFPKCDVNLLFFINITVSIINMLIKKVYNQRSELKNNHQE